MCQKMGAPTHFMGLTNPCWLQLCPVTESRQSPTSKMYVWSGSRHQAFLTKQAMSLLCNLLTCLIWSTPSSSFSPTLIRTGGSRCPPPRPTHPCRLPPSCLSLALSGWQSPPIWTSSPSPAGGSLSFSHTSARMSWRKRNVWSSTRQRVNRICTSTATDQEDTFLKCSMTSATPPQTSLLNIFLI